MTKCRSKATAIALFLTLTMAITIVALPTANAQTPEKATYAYIGALPNPVGVGQDVLLHVGITDPLYIDSDGWEGLSITIERPDGDTETIEDIRTDSTGGTGYVYSPDIPGDYILQSHFPQQEYSWPPGAFGGPGVVGPLIYKASDSEKLTLVVQEDPVPYYPGLPLPAEYWTRPIDSQLREWAAISGNWLETPRDLIAPYNDGPETPHILWAKPLTSGGLSGGGLDSHGYETGDAYKGKWQSPVIIKGVLFYNRYPSTFLGSLNPQQGIVAVDLHTGKELWFRNNTNLAFGQVLYYNTRNSHGTLAYLWEVVGSTWNAYDPFTGEWVYTMTNMPSAGGGIGEASLTRRGENGEFLIYTIDLTNGWMTMWNSTNVPSLYGMPDPTIPGFGFTYYSWMPEGKVVNATGLCAVTPLTPLGQEGYMWNKTIDKGLPGSVNVVLDDRIIGSTCTAFGSGKAPTPLTFWGISIKPDHEGELLFNKTWQTPSGDLEISFGAASLEDSVFTVWAKELRAHYGFSLDTGQYLWGPTDSQHYLDIYYATINTIAYGKLYSAGTAGIVYCNDVETGELLWTYEADDPYQEILWANDWWMRPLFITDGKIYLNHEEHSVIDPKPRGAPTICLNATTGEVIWRINGAFRGTHWGGRALIGDSVIATMDTYDQQIYAIGKGPSATTVTAPDLGVPFGSSVTIRGTVMDTSPGTEEYSLTSRFPNGVPAVSDDSMSDWMLYVYKQFARPANATGVEVTLDVLDANGNYREIGATTSDADGFFSFSWKPDIPGKFTVYASFAGSESYWPSHAVTAFTVDAAPEATPQPTPTPAPMTDMYIFGATTGIIIAIVVVGLVIVLMLRKR